MHGLIMEKQIKTSEDEKLIPKTYKAHKFIKSAHGAKYKKKHTYCMFNDQN